MSPDEPGETSSSDDRFGSPADEADEAAAAPTAESADRGSGADAWSRRDHDEDEKYCMSCGSLIAQRAEICPECGVRLRGEPPTSDSDVDRTTAAVFAMLLGEFGAHKFYLGKPGLGVLYLCFFWTLIPGIVGVVEGIIYLTQSDEEFHRKHVQ